MSDPLDQLYDIEGLDAISWWPLSPAWWGIVALSIVLFIALSFYLYRRRIYKRSWQRYILNQLKHMEQNLTPANSLATARDFSELIRRIAINHTTRQKCAGLAGHKWLAWLKDNDPQNFDWEEEGNWLADVIYAPDNAMVPLDKLQICIKAIRRWIK